MQCLRCQHENRTAAKFCEQCGTSLGPVCVKCGSHVSPKARFCSQCAHPVEAKTIAPAAGRFALPDSDIPKHFAQAELEGERKQATVLFADIRGSMELIADRDPEDAQKLL